MGKRGPKKIKDGLTSSKRYALRHPERRKESYHRYRIGQAKVLSEFYVRDLLNRQGVAVTAEAIESKRRSIRVYRMSRCFRMMAGYAQLH